MANVVAPPSPRRTNPRQRQARNSSSGNSTIACSLVNSDSAINTPLQPQRLPSAASSAASSQKVWIESTCPQYALT